LNFSFISSICFNNFFFFFFFFFEKKKKIYNSGEKEKEQVKKDIGKINTQKCKGKRKEKRKKEKEKGKAKIIKQQQKELFKKILDSE